MALHQPLGPGQIAALVFTLAGVALGGAILTNDAFLTKKDDGAAVARHP